MPVLLRSKSRRLQIRDGRLPTDPLREFGPADGWVRFEHLPAGMVPGFDPDVDVRDVEEPAPELVLAHEPETKHRKRR